MITLPYPAAILNPNKKTHWAKKWKAQKAQKDYAYLAAKAAGIPPQQDVYHLEITFYPPDKRRRDMDNALASCKGAFDGIALAWGVDDSKFRYAQKWGEDVKGGKIIIKLSS